MNLWTSTGGEQDKTGPAKLPTPLRQHAVQSSVSGLYILELSTNFTLILFEMYY
jgi:hypothetical protein